MTPRERAVAALSGKIPDRVPCVPLVDTSYAVACAELPVSECFLNPEAYAAALVATLDRHPDIDGVSINIGLSSDVVVEHTRDQGTHRVKTTGGLTWLVPENDNSLLGCASYRKFVMPFEKMVVDRIHAIGKPAILHICGKLDQSLESTLETGADGAEIDWQVNIPQAKRRVGARLTLKGNLNTATLVRSKPDEVYALTRELIAQGKPEGRFMVSSGCCLGRDTPPENVDAMVRACEDNGAYS